MLTAHLRWTLAMSVVWAVGFLGCEGLTPQSDEQRVSVTSERRVTLPEREELALQPGSKGASTPIPGSGVSDAKSVVPEAKPPPETSAGGPVALPSADGVNAPAIGVKRMVIANEIREREPVPLTGFSPGAPIVAFLELTNVSAVESKVQVVFHHESGKSAGLFELPVPANTNRWRTWARSELVKGSGTWTAVVSQVGGPELQRRTFLLP